jgi:hypothetical protein
MEYDLAQYEFEYPPVDPSWTQQANPLISGASQVHGIEEVVGSIPSGSTKFLSSVKFETTSAAQMNAVW